jgi:hypothetical protein
VRHYRTLDRNGTPLMTPRQFLGHELCRARVAAGFSSQQALAEMVLRRLIGSAGIMHDQLMHLADLSGRPNLSLHVVPSGVGAHAGLSGDISLASGDGDPDVLHTDAVPEGHTTETRPLVRRAAVTFERIRRDALPCVQSRDLILEVANEQWKQ